MTYAFLVEQLDNIHPERGADFQEQISVYSMMSLLPEPLDCLQRVDLLVAGVLGMGPCAIDIGLPMSDILDSDLTALALTVLAVDFAAASCSDECKALLSAIDECSGDDIVLVTFSDDQPCSVAPETTLLKDIGPELQAVETILFGACLPGPEDCKGGILKVVSECSLLNGDEDGVCAPTCEAALQAVPCVCNSGDEMILPLLAGVVEDAGSVPSLQYSFTNFQQFALGFFKECQSFVTELGESEDTRLCNTDVGEISGCPGVVAGAAIIGGVGLAALALLA
jgi:hypothetical protein